MQYRGATGKIEKYYQLYAKVRLSQIRVSTFPCLKYNTSFRLITETLYFWVLRSGFLLIKVQTDLDDSVVLADHCDYIVKILSVILQPNIKTLEQDFTIDLRNFGNFQVKDDNLCSEGDLLEMGIKAGYQT